MPTCASPTRPRACCGWRPKARRRWRGWRCATPRHADTAAGTGAWARASAGERGRLGAAHRRVVAGRGGLGGAHGGLSRAARRRPFRAARPHPGGTADRRRRRQPGARAVRLRGVHAAPAGAAALARLGASGCSEGADLPMPVTLVVLRSDMTNAVALPGGRVYVFEALLQARAESDELAGVVGARARPRRRPRRTAQGAADGRQRLPARPALRRRDGRRRHHLRARRLRRQPLLARGGNGGRRFRRRAHAGAGPPGDAARRLPRAASTARAAHSCRSCPAIR